jgi:hypothetical protein
MRTEGDMYSTLEMLELSMLYLGEEEDELPDVPLPLNNSREDMRNALREYIDHIRDHMESDRDILGEVYSGDHIEYDITPRSEILRFRGSDAVAELKKKPTNQLRVLEDLSQGEEYINALSSHYAMPASKSDIPLNTMKPALEEDGTLPYDVQQELQEVLDIRRDRGMLSPPEESESAETPDTA